MAASFKKITECLQALDKAQMGRLKRFLYSSYFNVPQQSVDFFEYLLSIYPEFPERKLEVKAIKAKLKKLHSTEAQAKAGSNLLKAIYLFLALEEWQRHEWGVNRHLFYALQKIGQFDVEGFEFQRTLQKIAAEPEQDVETFFYRHIFTEVASNGFDAKLNRTVKNEINPTIKTLDEFYSLKMLRYMCEAVSRRRVLGIAVSEEKMAEVLKALEPFVNDSFPYPYLFVNVYHMLTAAGYDEGLGFYEVIKKHIAATRGAALAVSSEEALSYALNWCIGWYNRGRDEMADDYLWWTDVKIKYGIFLEGGKLEPVAFRNIMSLAAMSSKPPEWMHDFIKNYSPLLPAEFGPTYLAFAEGLYYYRAKNFTKAIQSLLAAQAREDAVFNATIRRWQYMCTYEQDAADTDLLLNQLSSFEKYLERHDDVLKPVKPVFEKFIGYARLLLDAVGKSGRHELAAKLAADEHFAGKPWLVKVVSG